MIHDRDTPPSSVTLGTAYRTSEGEVFVWETGVHDELGVRWRLARVVYTVFGSAPDAVDLDLAAFPSPSKVNEGPRLHWKEVAIPEDAAWPDAEITHGVGSMHLTMSHHGDDPSSYFLEVAGLELKQVEQRWRHVAHTLVPSHLWLELEPVTP